MNSYKPWGEVWNFVALMSFTFGLIWGSFFNVCIYRIPVKKSVVRPPSHCYNCGSFLRWFDNIPLLSYLILQGVCRTCGTRFSIRYFLVELFTGFMFLGIFLRFGFQWTVPFHIAFASLLLVGVFTDIDHFILPDGITIGGTIFALFAALILGRLAIVTEEFALARDIVQSFTGTARGSPPGELPHYTAIGWAVLSAGLGYGLLWAVGLMGRVLFRKEAMGGGDIKLFALLGAYLGAVNCLWILFLAALLGSVLGLTLIAIHQLVGKDEYEEIRLNPGRAVKTHFQPVEARPEAITNKTGDALSDAEVINAQESVPVYESDTYPADPAPVIVRIARKTTRQLHHFPFGPYIAVAAFIVLIFHREINRFTREFFFLPVQ